MTPITPAGRLQKRVVLQINAPTADTVNQQRSNWTAVGTYWAKLTQLSGSEAPNADRLKALAIFEVTMRYVGPISPATHRLVYGTRVLNIESATNLDENGREWRIVAREVKNPA